MRLGHSGLLAAGLVAIHLFSGGCASRQAAENGRIRPDSKGAGSIDLAPFGELQQIYATPIPAQIRKTFDQTSRHVCSKKDGECSGCAFTVYDGGKRVDIFTKKFIVVGLEPAHFGGVEATIVFEGAPNAFWLWLYDIGPSEYQLRSIEQLPVPLDKGLVRQLQAPAYQRYWL